jgi:APA family basic amino acid/polyamine antiporter
MSNPRVYYAMAEDKILPPVFLSVNPKTQVQQFGLTFFIGVMLLSVFLLGDFENIVNYVLFIDSISLASAAAAIFILRKKSNANYDGFKMKGYPIIPFVFMATLLFVTYNTIVADPKSSLYGFIIFLGGLPLYFLMHRMFNTSKTH